jgi:hypothetical protein
MEKNVNINMIVESVMSKIEDKSQETLIENIVMNEMAEFLTEKTIEKKDKKKRAANMKAKRKIVLAWLRKEGLDRAEIRRMLEGEPKDQQEEDAKRSYFMKKIHQKFGKSFTDSEINKLYKIKSSFGQ